tara:strand:- start:26 stop:295 length:270 start_codon:yes stop_codon:yes gene_type:complete
MWIKSVNIYGAFGKNSSQKSSSKTIIHLFCFRKGLMIMKLVTAHGINAKKRFQLRKRYILLPKKKYLEIERRKHEIESMKSRLACPCLP